MPHRSKSIRLAVARLERTIEEYKQEQEESKRDWKTYEQQYAKRARLCFQELEPLVEEATSIIKINKNEKRGKNSKLTLKQKVLLLLLKHFCSKSNRSMEWMVVLFLWLSNIDVSYKTIERLYSDEAVRLAIYNLHILILKKKGLMTADCCGDGTGYSVCITEHYATEAQKLKDGIKEASKKFIYSFAIMDINTRLYIGYGTSFKSEKAAFENALLITKSTDINVNTLRLDKYFSGEAYVKFCQDYLGKVKMYIIPKSNVAHLGLGDWGKMLIEFRDNTKGFLKKYFQRNQSESGFSEDKKRTGWRIIQKLAPRIDTAYALTIVWHNQFWLGADL
jgi:transposase